VLEVGTDKGRLTGFGFKFSQFCILKTGLIHVSFFRALPSAPSLLRTDVVTQIDYHTHALVAGQRGGKEAERKMTIWLREWISALADVQADL
jgi:hypothetical protein